MKIIDPGHIFELQQLDVDIDSKYIVLPPELRFVKKEGEKYPGNKGHYPGTNIQEVLRACISRVEYLNNQIPHEGNNYVKWLLTKAIFILECRAAERHNRPFPDEWKCVSGPCCPKCLHVGCKGSCR